MSLNYLFSIMRKHKNDIAIVWRNNHYTYEWLLKKVEEWRHDLTNQRIEKNSIVALEGDFSPKSVALLLALIENENIVVPMSVSSAKQKAQLHEVAQVQHIIAINESDDVRFDHYANEVKHPILLKLKSDKHPGLILFSSGSTGNKKAAVHDFIPLLEKFTVPRQSKKILSFLLFDHIGGLNTLFYTLFNGGCVITVNSRQPDEICRAIQDYKVQVLPTSPTFINLFLLSEAYKIYNLSSLELVTYGTEVMPESTLKKFHELFPYIRLQQTYGLSELGILRSKSKSSDSLFVKIGGEGFETRIQNGLLEVKAKSAMLGYLNAPSSFTEDGWFMTGDVVEVEGEYFKILGRTSEMINVGGEKVYPAEVESVLQQMHEIEEVAVSGEKNPITGSIVKAVIKLREPRPLNEFKKTMRIFCKNKLESFKVPQKIILTENFLHNERFKKVRRDTQMGE